MTALLGLVTAVSWAFSNLFTHRLSRLQLELPVVMAGILAVATAARVPIALIADRGEGPWTLHVQLWPMAGGASAVAGLFLLVRALSVGSLSVVAPIIAVEGGIVMRKERLQPVQYSGIVVTLSAITALVIVS